jgi:hypothetical protein
VNNAVLVIDNPHSGALRALDLIAFSKTGAPIIDHAWVDNSPTYAAVLMRGASKEVAEAAFIPGVKSQGNYEGRHTPETPISKLDVFKPKSLNDFAAECHNGNNLWWQDPATGERIDRNIGELLMLVVTELAECMEGERKNLMDDHLPHRKMAEVELADALIRIGDIAGSRKLDLDQATRAIVEYKPLSENKGRALLSIVSCVQSADTITDYTMARKLARAIKRIEAYAIMHGYDVWSAVDEKREYNKTREDHTVEARLAPNGKKF